MVEPIRRRWLRGVGVVSLLAFGGLSGCAMVPRGQFEESRRLTQTLRTENARLKDEVVVLRTQNRDYADRAVDDLRRLTARDEAIERLEQSVQGYQDDRDRLAAAYRRLAVSLGRTSQDSSVEATSASRADSPDRGTAGNTDLRRGPDPEPPDIKQDGDADDTSPRPQLGESDP